MATPNDVPGLHKMNPVNAYLRGKADAEKQAKADARKEVLDMLEKMYMSPDVERDSPTAKAILTVAKDIAQEYRERGV